MSNGLIITYFGNGKGKTTAALGVALRAIGYDMNVCMIQFIKGEWNYGEIYSSNRLRPNFELIIAGKGFVGILDDDHDISEHINSAKSALEIAKEKINSLKYDTVILDEVNYALKLKLIEEGELISILRNKPQCVNVILTGNHMTDQILNISDLVTEMKEVKHPYKKGIRAKKGIDF
ncbi:cob(I)yrinic acid a,c-diamide adenosyltransferase [Candidatus Nitrosocosmicus franklandus]|uniref:Cob(I)yrinic acid a,c-diamide adenosyltransferase n=1 Tax=Candidatus Nitrosocosmicus franklandianus TaxID=1798806 RepID=A0A484IDX5_9ARCH|nr:cob(I)yrinic acid a,c-diamide adenosyltransferase [Candidatus Nitrosocosmicus franklandus]VFJ15016.1 Cob(I)yrinic acid a,c-diamide adenosyltransferase [Candidatus Nitrosocosmicus franklandus]